VRLALGRFSCFSWHFFYPFTVLSLRTIYPSFF
jgi:hypothetical protein